MRKSNLVSVAKISAV